MAKSTTVRISNAVYSADVPQKGKIILQAIVQQKA
jgi:hypothetical protein